MAVMRAWKRRRAPTKLCAVVEANGMVHTDTAGKVHALLRHWAQTVAGSATPGRGAEFARGRVLRRAEDGWVMSRHRFNEVVLGMRSSAPGPDGLLYLAWKLSPAIWPDALYECYVDWISTARLPGYFSFPFLALVPKVQSEDLAPGETTMLWLAVGPKVHSVLTSA